MLIMDHETECTIFSPEVCIDKIDSEVIHLCEGGHYCNCDRVKEGYLDNNLTRIMLEWHLGLFDYFWASNLPVNDEQCQLCSRQWGTLEIVIASTKSGTCVMGVLVE
jgi:hypothetical protein